MNTQAKVALNKQEHPERYCPAPRCLWKTTKLNHATQVHEGGGYCPRHKPTDTWTTIKDWDSKRNPIVSAEQFTGSLDEELTNQDMLDAEEEL